MPLVQVLHHPRTILTIMSFNLFICFIFALQSLLFVIFNLLFKVFHVLEHIRY